jgi:DNA (cytosine-5)-methyltransferase 1
MKYFSLFSGVGGFEQGFPKDWEGIGMSEIDRFASQVLKYNYPNVRNYGDISKIDWRQVPDFDVLTGGSPCQDFSIAGKRRGLTGSRSALAWEYIRCLRDKQPRYFIWENVKGVLSSNEGKDFECICEEFCKSGYAIDFEVLNAKNFGVPQNRERIFLIGKRLDLLDSADVI